MKTLFAPSTVGRAKGEFAWTIPGEPLTFGYVCDHAESCGCNRSLTGAYSLKGTTVGVVKDAPIDEMRARKLWVKAWKSQEIARRAVAGIHTLSNIVAAWPLGSVVKFNVTGRVDALECYHIQNEPRFRK